MPIISSIVRWHFGNGTSIIENEPYVRDRFGVLDCVGVSALRHFGSEYKYCNGRTCWLREELGEVVDLPAFRFGPTE